MVFGCAPAIHHTFASICAAAPAGDGPCRPVEGNKGADGGNELCDFSKAASGGLTVATIGAGTPALQGLCGSTVGHIGVLVAADLRHLAEVDCATGAAIGAMAPASASFSDCIEGQVAQVSRVELRHAGKALRAAVT